MGGVVEYVIGKVEDKWEEDRWGNSWEALLTT